MASCPLNHFFSPAQRARYLAAIPRRYSCRRFAAPPDIPTLAALNYAAARVCLPGVRIALCECADELFIPFPFTGGFHGVRRCAAVIVPREGDLPALLAGVSGEAFVLEATAMGMGTCWAAGIRKSMLDIDVAEHERVTAVIALGVPEDAEHEVSRKRKKLSQLCIGDPAQWPLWAYHAAEAVRQAPSALNLQPWKLTYARRSLQLLGRKADRLDYGIALMHMEAAAGDVNRLWEWGEHGAVAHLVAEESE